MSSRRPVSLPVLLREVRACTICAPHLPLGPRPVLQAAAGARILIAGQAPGRRVHQTGVPFDDPSGDRLRDWLGVDRNTFYDPQAIAILPMGFCYPGTGRSGDLPPRPECAPAWRDALLDRLPGIRLTLLLGQHAQRWHLDSGATRLTDIVRQWRRYWPAVLPLPHPSPRNRIWLRKNPWFEDEVLPALRRRVRRLIPARTAAARRKPFL
ncbi:MAG: uracil-DNA glycosylase family protein [Gemmatimonadales bacterium]